MEYSGRTYLKILVNLVIALVTVLLLIFLLPKVIVFFMPFIMGWLIATIASPLAKFLESKLKIKKKAGSAVIIIAVIAIVVLLCYFILSKLWAESAGLLAELPEMWNGVTTNAQGLNKYTGVLSKYFPDDLTNTLNGFGEQIGQYMADFLNNLGNTDALTRVGDFAKQVPTLIIGIFMCFLSSYFFITEKEYMALFCREHFPKTLVSYSSHLWSSIKQVVGGYIIAQIKIEIWIYILLVIGFLILHVDYAVLIALGIAFIDFLPVFGSGFVMWPWAVIAAINGNFRLCVGLVIIWGLGQLARQMIQPKIVGDSMGLAPLPTLLLLFVGYKIGGFVGMIFAVPIGIVILNMYKEGAFDTTIKSIQILIEGINNFRKFTKSELEIAKEEDTDESHSL